MKEGREREGKSLASVSAAGYLGYLWKQESKTVKTCCDLISSFVSIAVDSKEPEQRQKTLFSKLSD